MKTIDNSFVYGQYIRRIAYNLMQMQDERLAPYNITSQQARLLGLIRLYLDQTGVCRQKDLEGGAGLRSPAITSLIKGLEQRGYVRRASGQQDHRTKEVELTEKGMELLETFLSIFRESERKIVTGMTPGERSILLELLKRAAENLG